MPYFASDQLGQKVTAQPAAWNRAVTPFTPKTAIHRTGYLPQHGMMPHGGASTPAIISVTATSMIRPSRHLCLQSPSGFFTRLLPRARILQTAAKLSGGIVFSSAQRSVGELQQGIAEFYDVSSGLWEDIRGEHMHHGFYEVDANDADNKINTNNNVNNVSDHRAAQIRMIEEALSFSGISHDPKSVVDVGCGIGGTSRYLGKKYGASVKGITLSPIQAQRANALAFAEGLADRVNFQVADALDQPFPDGEFDLVWSMESGEHIPDKEMFMKELTRVVAPGGFIIIVTWCHRDLLPGEVSLQPSEEELLDKICGAYYLPAWCSTADYVKLAQALSLQDIKTADWSEHVAPFWPAVIRSALSWKGVMGLIKSGFKTIKGALAMPLMVKGYNQGLIKYAVITGRKPG